LEGNTEKHDQTETGSSASRDTQKNYLKRQLKITADRGKQWKVSTFCENCLNFNFAIRRKRKFAMTWGFVTCGPNEALVVSGKTIFKFLDQIFITLGAITCWSVFVMFMSLNNIQDIRMSLNVKILITDTSELTFNQIFAP
jgi:hypothetical protein